MEMISFALFLLSAFQTEAKGMKQYIVLGGFFASLNFFMKGNMHAGSASLLATFIAAVGWKKFWGIRDQRTRIETAALREKLSSKEK